ncbi:MAG: NmrA family NAD(P)-binding protein [Sandaracinaceae bacterium]
MTRPLVLITGATGKTGAPTLELLRERGARVRALVRTRDDRSARLAALGAQVVVGDFLDLRSMRAALDGVDRAYFCYPPDGTDLLEATSIFGTAAKDAGVRSVVNMSQISADEASSSFLARQHWLAENVLDWAQVGAIHVRPTFFAEMLFILAGPSIAEEGRIYLPYGDESHAPVAASDIARVVVGALLDPDPHVGRRLVVTGDRNRTVAEMAQVIAGVLGRDVAYVDLPNEAWGRALASVPGLTPSLIEHLQAVANEHKKGVFRAVTDVVERVGGAPPVTLEAFVRAHRERFEASAAAE